MKPVRVKICGITRREDAEAAVRLGADALGFVFWPKSPRVVDIAAARAISIAVPALVARVGVFVDASPDDVTSVVKHVGLDAVQLHGSEDVNAYRAVPARLIKAVTLESDADVERAASLPSHVTVLVDATDPVQRGGTGKSADWSRAAMLAARRPILLAGGLSADNVGDAIDAVRPWGVDVSSGVESAPGVKHVGKLTMLFAAVRPETSAIGHHRD